MGVFEIGEGACTRIDFSTPQPKWGRDGVQLILILIKQSRLILCAAVAKVVIAKLAFFTLVSSARAGIEMGVATRRRKDTGLL